MPPCLITVSPKLEIDMNQKNWIDLITRLHDALPHPTDHHRLLNDGDYRSQHMARALRQGKVSVRRLVKQIERMEDNCPHRWRIDCVKDRSNTIDWRQKVALTAFAFLNLSMIGGAMWFYENHKPKTAVVKQTLSIESRRPNS